MNNERKIENEMFHYSVYRGKQTYASEMKRKRRKLGTESCLTASHKSENWGRITVWFMNFTKSSFRKVIL